MSLTVAAATRRLVGLTALRWLPNGLVVPVTVLLASSRGLSPADIGLAFTVHSVIVVALELPTGGLADALGRRAVLVAGGLLHAGGLLALAVADGLGGFCLAYALVGVGRALDSGPLEAWYVDTVAALDPRADVTPGLSRAGVADGAALCLGAVAGGVLPLLASDLLWLPFVVAAAMALVHVTAVLLVVTPVAPAGRRRTVTEALLEGLADVPRTVGGAVRLAAVDRALRLVLAIAFATGLVLMTLELLGPLRFAALAGGAAEGTSVYGIVVAVSFAAAALGSGLALRARALAGGSAPVAMAVLAGLCTLALLGVAAGPTVVLVGIPYAAFYLFHGASSPLRKRLVHDRVPSHQRATMVSAGSLALQLGGIAGNLVQPRLYEGPAPAAAFGAAALALLLIAGLSLRLRGCLPTAEPGRIPYAGRAKSSPVP